MRSLRPDPARCTRRRSGQSGRCEPSTLPCAAWLPTLVLLAALWLPTHTLAQEAAPAANGAATAPATPEPPPIQAIPLEDVPDRAEQAATELMTLVPDEASAESLRKVRADFEAGAEETVERLASSRASLDSAPTVQSLRELENGLQGMLVPIREWDQALDADVRKLATALQRVEEIEAIWKETRKAARERGAPASLVRSVESTQSEAADARQKVVTRRDEILTLRARFGDRKGGIDTVLHQVEREIQVRLEGVFSLDRPPIWSAEMREALRQEMDEDWSQPFQDRLAVTAQYAGQKLRLFGFQVALFLALVLALRALAVRAHERAVEDYDLREAKIVFEYPISMALVITLAISPQLHPVAPRLFSLLIGTVAVIPAVLIVRRLTPRSMLPLLVGLLIFFFTDRVRAILETLPTVERMILLVELLGAVAFLLWLIRPKRFAEVSPEMLRGSFLRVVGFAVRVIIVLFSVAAVAEVVGLGDLAQLIGNATLRSSYTALFVFALLKALQSLMAYALVARPLRLLRLVPRNRALIRRRVRSVLQVLATALWIYLTLTFFGIDEPMMASFTAVLGAELGVGSVSISLGNVLVFGLTVWVSFQLARFLNFFLYEEIFPKVQLARGVPYAVSSLLRYSLIVLGFLFALAAAGIDFSNLTVVAGGLGVGIGFGLQNVVNNFVSGLILLFERPLQVGDAVQLPNLWGEIRRIGIRASVIRTWDGAEVIVPNGLLVSEAVTNWTLSDRRRRVDVKVGVEYGTDAQRVIDLLIEVARAHPSVIDDPAPLAYFTGFGDSALEFLLRAWIREFGEGYTVRSDLAVAVQRALREADISVPFPQRDLHLRSVSEGVAAELSAGAQRARPGRADDSDGDR